MRKRYKCLNSEEVALVVRDLEAKHRVVDIAKRFGVSASTVSRVGIQHNVVRTERRGRPRGAKAKHVIVPPPSSEVKGVSVTRGHMVLLRIPRNNALPPIRHSPLTPKS